MPVRTCIGCQSAAPATELVRLTRAADGTLRVGGAGPGRGAWLCRGAIPGLPQRLCVDQAARRQAFGRAFRKPVSPEAVAALRETVEERARIETGGAAGAVARRD